MALRGGKPRPASQRPSGSWHLGCLAGTSELASEHLEEGRTHVGFGQEAQRNRWPTVNSVRRYLCGGDGLKDLLTERFSGLRRVEGVRHPMELHDDIPPGPDGERVLKAFGSAVELKPALTLGARVERQAKLVVPTPLGRCRFRWTPRTRRGTSARSRFAHEVARYRSSPDSGPTGPSSRCRCEPRPRRDRGGHR